METLFLDGRVYQGIEGLKRWRSDIASVLEYDRFAPQAIRLAGEDCVVVFGRLHLKGRTSGIETDVPLVPNELGFPYSRKHMRPLFRQISGATMTGFRVERLHCRDAFIRSDGARREPGAPRIN